MVTFDVAKPKQMVNFLKHLSQLLFTLLTKIALAGKCEKAFFTILEIADPLTTICSKPRKHLLKHLWQ